MIIFYVFILAMNVLVLINGQITLEYVLNRIQKRNITYRFLTYLFMVVASYILYPMGISLGVLSFLLIIITYFYVGGIFYGLHSSPLKVFGVTSILQATGLMIKILFSLQANAGGGSSLEHHWILYLILVPSFITVIYLLVPLFLKMEEKNYANYREKL